MSKEEKYVIRLDTWDYKLVDFMAKTAKYWFWFVVPPFAGFLTWAMTAGSSR